MSSGSRTASTVGLWNRSRLTVTSCCAGRRVGEHPGDHLVPLFDRDADADHAVVPAGEGVPLHPVLLRGQVLAERIVERADHALHGGLGELAPVDAGVVV